MCNFVRLAEKIIWWSWWTWFLTWNIFSFVGLIQKWTQHSKQFLTLDGLPVTVDAGGWDAGDGVLHPAQGVGHRLRVLQHSNANGKVSRICIGIANITWEFVTVVNNCSGSGWQQESWAHRCSAATSIPRPGRPQIYFSRQALKRNAKNVNAIDINDWLFSMSPACQEH